MSGPSRQEVWKMFDALAFSYDHANRWMTLGLDLYWRKKVGFFLPKGKNLNVLDCATGTADQILSLLRHRSQITRVTGVDLAEQMLEAGRKKVEQSPFAAQITLQREDVLHMSFAESTFDCVTMSFGIRNVTDVSGCLAEIARVLKPGGKLLILETSIPSNQALRHLHLWYLRNVIPRVGGIISKKKEAYDYLHKTTESFPTGDGFCQIMKASGYQDVKKHPLTGGIVTIYEGSKIR